MPSALEVASCRVSARMRYLDLQFHLEMTTIAFIVSIMFGTFFSWCSCFLGKNISQFINFGNFKDSISVAVRIRFNYAGYKTFGKVSWNLFFLSPSPILYFELAFYILFLNFVNCKDLV